MKTKAVIAGPDGVVRLLDAELPPMSDTRVRVETLFSGVSCGTEGDIASGRGTYLSRPCILGYQAVGRVVEAGAKVSQLVPGDLVFTTGGGLWESEHCYGGSHARESVAESADVVRLDSAIPSLMTAAYAQLAAVAAEGLGGTKFRTDAPMMIFGLGMLGQMAGKLAQLRGVRVIGINRSAWKCEVATAFGFEQVAAPESAPIQVAIKRLSLGAPLCAVDTTGKPEIFDLAVSQLGSPAELVLLGYYPDKFQVDFNACHGKRLIIHNPVGGGSHVPGILRLVEEGLLNLEPLIRHVTTPSEITGFYADMVRDHSRYLGAVIDWSKPSGPRNPRS